MCSIEPWEGTGVVEQAAESSCVTAASHTVYQRSTQAAGIVHCAEVCKPLHCLRVLYVMTHILNANSNTVGIMCSHIAMHQAIFEKFDASSYGFWHKTAGLNEAVLHSSAVCPIKNIRMSTMWARALLFCRFIDINVYGTATVKTRHKISMAIQIFFTVCWWLKKGWGWFSLVMMRA